MSQEQPNLIANIIAQSNDATDNNPIQSGFVGNIFNKIGENKMYIYIVIVIILLAGVGYYVYKNNIVSKNKKEIEQQIQPQIQNNYYVIDSEGNPIPVQEDDIESIRQQAIRHRTQQKVSHNNHSHNENDEDNNIVEQELTKSEMEEINKNLENINN